MPNQPIRVQRRRSRGWRLPPRTKCVTAPGPYQNPFRPEVHTPEAHAEAVARFREWIYRPEQAALVDRVRNDLRGFSLACYCRPDLPCHANVLLEIANDATQTR